MGNEIRTAVKHGVLPLGCLIILLFIPRGCDADPRWLPHSHLIAFVTYFTLFLHRVTKLLETEFLVSTSS